MIIELTKLRPLPPTSTTPRINDGVVDVVAVSLRELGTRQHIGVDEGVIIIGQSSTTSTRRHAALAPDRTMFSARPAPLPNLHYPPPI